MKWPRSACEELRCTVVWDIGGLPSGRSEAWIREGRAPPAARMWGLGRPPVRCGKVRHWGGGESPY